MTATRADASEAGDGSRDRSLVPTSHATGAGVIGTVGSAATLFGGTFAWMARSVLGASLDILELTERQVSSLINLMDPGQPAPTKDERALKPVDPAANGRMGRLLSDAVVQSTHGGRQALYARLVGDLVPDEAKIIGALSDGRKSPLMNVLTRSVTGRPSRVVLANMSLIGKTANLAVPEYTPMYVGHLLSLGLVEIGAEERSLKTEYEILGADTIVLSAIKKAGRSVIPAAVERRVLKLSPLGHELWLAIAASEAGG